MAAYYEGADIVRQAALLGVGISQAQAFLDGNKRTAYLALNTFLRMNGLAYQRRPAGAGPAVRAIRRTLAANRTSDRRLRGVAPSAVNPDPAE